MTKEGRKNRYRRLFIISTRNLGTESYKEGWVRSFYEKVLFPVMWRTLRKRFVMAIHFRPSIIMAAPSSRIQNLETKAGMRLTPGPKYSEECSAENAKRPGAKRLGKLKGH